MLGCLFFVSGCAVTERLSKVGTEPPLTQISNPQLDRNYKPVSMPMPNQIAEDRQPNSLWTTGRQAFFEDQRATAVGDIVTVIINIDDQAQLDNTTTRTRQSNENAGLKNLLGLEGSFNRVLPEAVNPAALVTGTSNSNSNGVGTIDRQEKIELKLAAIITQILPNGNFVIQGKQEIRVNFEKRVLQLSGIIRPQDITLGNTIPSEQIAEARVSYGGEGHISDVQQPRYGQQIFDVLFPF
jgi:flagellar L-ring protein precursor FlgH